MHPTVINSTIRSGALLFALVLCLATGAEAAKEKGATRLQLQGIAGGTAVLEFAAAPLISMSAIPLRLELMGMDGTPQAGATIHCDLTMPAMAMPENRPAMREIAPGIYAGEAVFTMAGAWQATFSVDRDDWGREILIFDIEQVRMK